VTSLGGPYTADPAWSPDGRWIAFRSYPQGVEGVFVTRAEGGAPKRLTSSDTDAGICGWSRDGKWIYYSSGPLNDIRLWKIPREGGASVPVTRGRGAGRAIESADGRFLYYLQSEEPVSSLWRMPLPSGEPEKVLDSVYGFNFAVTGTGVFFISHPDWPSVDFLRFADHKILTVARLSRAHSAYGMSIAPDGHSLLFGQFVEHSGDLMLVENFH